MAPHSSTLPWKIKWTEEPGRLQFMGLLRVRHDWVTSLWLVTFLHWRQPTPVFLPGETQGWGTRWAAVYGVAQSQTRLKRLSSSSSSSYITSGWRLAQGTLSAPFWCLCQKLSLSLLYFNKTLLHKVLSDQASSLALDWILLLWRPRILVSFVVQQQTFASKLSEFGKW